MRKVLALSFSVGLALVVIVGINALQLEKACGACWISWTGNSTTCTVADAEGDFTYEVTTLASSYRHADVKWVLCQGLTTTDNIALGPDANPDTVDIEEPGEVASEQIETTCSGTLYDPLSNGSTELNAWDNTYYGCADSFGTTIKRYGQSCP